MNTLLKLTGKFLIMLSLLGSTALIYGCKSDKKHAAKGPVRVTTMTVGSGANASDSTSISYSGTIEAGTGTTLSFSDGGTVKNVFVKVGDKVSKGQLLAELDNVQLTNAYDIAKAELEQAEDAYRRLKMLHDAKALPEIKWVEMESKLKQARSAAEIAKKALSNARLYAPNSGVISERMIENGMNVVPAVPVLRLVTVNDIKAVITVPENMISRFGEGMTCRVTAKGAGERSYDGKLSVKGVEATPLTHEFTVKFDIKNPDNKLLPGMICDVELERMPGETKSDETVSVLPVKAVMLDFDNRTFVWLKKNGHAVKRYVTVNILEADGLTVESGLNAGDSIIVDGQQKVSSGMAVTEAISSPAAE